MPENSNQARARRRITFRRVSLEQIGDHNTLLAFCPRNASVRPVEECRRCEHFAGLCVDPTESGALLRCAYADEAITAQADDAAIDEATATPASTTRVAAIMTTPLRLATPDLSLEDLAALFLSEKIGALPVADSAGKPIGIVTKTDVMESYYNHAEASHLSHAAAVLDQGSSHDQEIAPELEATVRDVMKRAVFAIGQNTSVSRAAALMAYEQVHHLLVVTLEGKALGIVSSLDVARWVARSDGYVVPKTPDPQA